MRRRSGIKRPGYIMPGDTRSPMHRLLAAACPDDSMSPGLVCVDYAQQWPTRSKAIRLGYVTEDFYITEKGKAWLAEQDKKLSKEHE